jgi:hypothetical protein
VKNWEQHCEYKREWFKFTDYIPHRGQEKVHFPEEYAPYRVYVCGRRFGKTLSAAKELEVTMSLPETRSWIVAPNHNLTDLVFREVWKTCVHNEKMDIRSKSNRKGEKYLETAWGSTLHAKSAENPDSLIGEGLDKVVMDESARMKKIIWDELLQPTLADRRGEGIFITTPKGYNHIYDKYKLGQVGHKEKDPDWYSYQAPSWVNQHVFPGGKRDKFLRSVKRNLTKESFDQEYGAKFTTYAGKVYPFDRYMDTGNFPYNPDLPTYCSIDFGYRMPAVGWYQTDSRDHIFKIDEISHETNIKTEVLARRVLAKPYRVVKYFGDPAGTSIGGSGLGDIEIFRRHGIKVHYKRDKVSKDISAGVEHVRSFMESADGERKFHVDKKCVNSIDDYEAYRYPEDEGKDLKLKPVKDGLHDHTCDETRYFIINRFPIRRGRFTLLDRSW